MVKKTHADLFYPAFLSEYNEQNLLDDHMRHVM
jgi:hypothetical protein